MTAPILVTGATGRLGPTGNPSAYWSRISASASLPGAPSLPGRCSAIAVEMAAGDFADRRRCMPPWPARASCCCCRRSVKSWPTSKSQSRAPRPSRAVRASSRFPGRTGPSTLPGLDLRRCPCGGRVASAWARRRARLHPPQRMDAGLPRSIPSRQAVTARRSMRGMAMPASAISTRAISPMSRCINCSRPRSPISR